jgi:hypothetical protein
MRATSCSRASASARALRRQGLQQRDLLGRERPLLLARGHEDGADRALGGDGDEDGSAGLDLLGETRTDERRGRDVLHRDRPALARGRGDPGRLAVQVDAHRRPPVLDLLPPARDQAARAAAHHVDQRDGGEVRADRVEDGVDEPVRGLLGVGGARQRVRELRDGAELAIDLRAAARSLHAADPALAQPQHEQGEREHGRDRHEDVFGRRRRGDELHRPK